VRKTLYRKGILPSTPGVGRFFPSFPRVARIPEIGRLESDSGPDYSTARSDAGPSWRRLLERYIYARKGPLASQQRERGIDWW
jgi:hypothetical protein